MQRIDFDLDRFIRTSDRVDLSEVEWARVQNRLSRPRRSAACAT